MAFSSRSQNLTQQAGDDCGMVEPDDWVHADMPDVSTTDSSERTSPTTRHRRAHRKVKTGCTACKVRRQKCGEQRPVCAGCRRHSTDCIYKDPNTANRSRRQAMTGELAKIAARSPVTTVQESLRVSPSPELLNLRDLELLHHYMTSTSFVTSQVPEATAQAQVAVPLLAQTHPYVMHMILAKAAVELAWLLPHQRKHYMVLAAQHHRTALPDFRASLQDLTCENHRAVIIFAKGLVWSSFAWLEPFASHQQAGSPLNEWLPTWFHLLRGSCKIVEACKKWISPGLYILPPPLDDLTEFLDGADSSRIMALQSHLSFITDSSICQNAISTLHEAFARASMSHHNTPLRNAMNFWVGGLPDEYFVALRQGEVWALIIMAHFCILVARSEAKWYMRGHAVEFLTSIKDRVPDSWKSYIEWPCRELGVSSPPT